MIERLPAGRGEEAVAVVPAAEWELPAAGEYRVAGGNGGHRLGEDVCEPHAAPRQRRDVRRADPVLVDSVGAERVHDHEQHVGTVRPLREGAGRESARLQCGRGSGGGRGLNEAPACDRTPHATTQSALWARDFCATSRARTAGDARRRACRAPHRESREHAPDRARARRRARPAARRARRARPPGARARRARAGGDGSGSAATGSGSGSAATGSGSAATGSGSAATGSGSAATGSVRRRNSQPQKPRRGGSSEISEMGSESGTCAAGSGSVAAAGSGSVTAAGSSSGAGSGSGSGSGAGSGSGSGSSSRGRLGLRLVRLGQLRPQRHLGPPSGGLYRHGAARALALPGDGVLRFELGDVDFAEGAEVLGEAIYLAQLLPQLRWRLYEGALRSEVRHCPRFRSGQVVSSHRIGPPRCRRAPRRAPARALVRQIPPRASAPPRTGALRVAAARRGSPGPRGARGPPAG